MLIKKMAESLRRQVLEPSDKHTAIEERIMLTPDKLLPTEHRCEFIHF
jgi:hypothetical protein